MKILVVNTTDRGGAANSCLRLYYGLILIEVDTSILLRQKTRDLPFFEVAIPIKKELSYFQKIKVKIRSLLILLNLRKRKSSHINPARRIRSESLELFSYPSSDFDITDYRAYKQADIINLHWVANFLDYKSFFTKNNKPVVWTLHDMNPFAGGEHYVERYLGIDDEGNPIKRKISKDESNIYRTIGEFKKQLFGTVSNLTIVTPSKWLAEEAKKSPAFNGKEIIHIPYGLDSTLFSPKEKNFSREVLGLPRDKKIILFVADSISNSRKGFIFLIKALQKLNLNNTVLCTVGRKNPDLIVSFEIIELGIVNDERLMSLVYSAADVFIIPSLMDNLPNTVLESLMCGTPVIGFPVGGISEMIKNKENGILTKEINVQSLVDAISVFFADPGIFKSEEIREDAVRNYNLENQAKRY